MLFTGKIQIWKLKLLKLQELILDMQKNGQKDCDKKRTQYLSFPWKLHDISTKMLFENPYEKKEVYEKLMVKEGHNYFTYKYESNI